MFNDLHCEQNEALVHSTYSKEDNSDLPDSSPMQKATPSLL